MQYAYRDRLLNVDEENVRHSLHEPHETHKHTLGKRAELYVTSGGTWSQTVAFWFVWVWNLLSHVQVRVEFEDVLEWEAE
jgi:hypothetical protein